jgi:hypothetical protein
MSVDAFLTFLGRSGPKRALYESESAWEAARQREEAFLRQVESRVNAQLDGPLALVGSTLDGTVQLGEASFDMEIEMVGGSDGIAPIQAFVIAVLVDRELPTVWRFDDPYEPLRRARALDFGQGLGAFRHLLDHDPVMGYYLPVDFPVPLWMPGELLQESRDLAVGSAVQLATELEGWKALHASFQDVPQWLVNHVENLAEVCRAAKRLGLAVEIA